MAIHFIKPQFIHYGHTKFNIKKFDNIKNKYGNKPDGGLWLSPVNSKWGWKDWCESERFKECNEKK